MKNKLTINVFVAIIIVLMVIGIIIVRYFSGLGTKSVKESNQPTNQQVINESSCAKIGERSVSNFDMTTGKINPNMKNKDCCSGLKNITEKQSIINKNSDVCSQSVGVSYNLCSPCGNGVCDSQYEDHCNCPEDCK